MGHGLSIYNGVICGCGLGREVQQHTLQCQHPTIFLIRHTVLRYMNGKPGGTTQLMHLDTTDLQSVCRHWRRSAQTLQCPTGRRRLGLCRKTEIIENRLLLISGG